MHRFDSFARILAVIFVLLQSSVSFATGFNEQTGLAIGMVSGGTYGSLPLSDSEISDSDGRSYATQFVSCLYDQLSRCFKCSFSKKTIFNYSEEDFTFGDDSGQIEDPDNDIENQLELIVQDDSESDLQVQERFGELMTMPTVTDLFINPKNNSLCAKTGRCFFGAGILLSKAPAKIKMVADKALEYRLGRGVKYIFVAGIWISNKIVQIDLVCKVLDYFYEKGWLGKVQIVGWTAKGLLNYVFVPRSMAVAEGSVKVALSKLLTTPSQQKKYLEIHDMMSEMIESGRIHSVIGKQFPENPVELIATALDPVVFKKVTSSLHGLAVSQTPGLLKTLDSEINCYILHVIISGQLFKRVLLPYCVLDGEHPAEWVETAFHYSYMTIYYPNYVKLAYKLGGI